MSTADRDSKITESYARLGNVHKVGLELGITHSVVHRRLVALGIPRSINHWSEEETEIIQREYVIYRDAGRLQELCDRLGRKKPNLVTYAKKLGLTNRDHYVPGKWKDMSEEAARVLFEEFRDSRYNLGQFTARRGLDDLSFMKTMLRFFPDEYHHAIESKQPRQSLYRRGREVEYRAMELLRRAGYYVMRSPASKSPIDIVGIRVPNVVFVQVKKTGNLGVTEWNDVFDLATSVGGIPVLAGAPKARVEFWKLTGRKDGSKNRQPYEPFEP